MQGNPKGTLLDTIISQVSIITQRWDTHYKKFITQIKGTRKRVDAVPLMVAVSEFHSNFLTLLNQHQQKINEILDIEDTENEESSTSNSQLNSIGKRPHEVMSQTDEPKLTPGKRPPNSVQGTSDDNTTGKEQAQNRGEQAFDEIVTDSEDIHLESKRISPTKRIDAPQIEKIPQVAETKRIDRILPQQEEEEESIQIADSFLSIEFDDVEEQKPKTPSNLYNLTKNKPNKHIPDSSEFVETLVDQKGLREEIRLSRKIICSERDDIVMFLGKKYIVVRETTQAGEHQWSKHYIDESHVGKGYHPESILDAAYLNSSIFLVNNSLTLLRLKNGEIMIYLPHNKRKGDYQPVQGKKYLRTDVAREKVIFNRSASSLHIIDAEPLQHERVSLDTGMKEFTDIYISSDNEVYLLSIDGCVFHFNQKDRKVECFKSTKAKTYKGKDKTIFKKMLLEGDLMLLGGIRNSSKSIKTQSFLLLARKENETNNFVVYSVKQFVIGENSDRKDNKLDPILSGIRIVSMPYANDVLHIIYCISEQGCQMSGFTVANYKSLEEFSVRKKKSCMWLYKFLKKEIDVGYYIINDIVCWF